VAVNAAAIPDELAESTLFGHERGSFTGADRARQGLVERAMGGTLFLDEIGDVSPRVQTRLLRLLQEGTFERVGGSREIQFEGRIVAATLRPVDTDTPGFRADLYYRLAACVIRVPPLRDRLEDLPELAGFLFARAVADLPVPLELTDDAVDALRHRDWPGNVRELENVLRSAIASAWALRSGVVLPAHLPASSRGPARGLTAPVATSAGPTTPPVPATWAPGPGPSTPAGPGAAALADATDAFQRARVEEALRSERGNRAAAARRLGVSKQWLHRLLNRWGREGFAPVR
jgi:DNA-binding NtrC family response regulator